MPVNIDGMEEVFSAHEARNPYGLTKDDFT